MSSDKEYRTSEGLGDVMDETWSYGQIQAVGKTYCRFSSLLPYHCDQRGKFFLFRKDSTVFSIKKRLTSGAIEHDFFKDMEVYSTNV